VKGRPWTVDEEKLLREMVGAHKSVRAIAKVLGKTRDCVAMKMARLGLEVVVGLEKNASTTTTSVSLVLREELPCIEAALRILLEGVLFRMQFCFMQLPKPFLPWLVGLYGVMFLLLFI
jgi:hypothetical protein